MTNLERCGYNIAINSKNYTLRYKDGEGKWAIVTEPKEVKLLFG